MAMSRSFAGTWLTTRPSIATVPDGDRLEPGDHAQHRRLAAARRPEQHHELAVGDGQVTSSTARLAAPS